MNGSLDPPLDSFPRLRLRQSDGLSRRSSFGAESESERYCSASNSVMGTPNTSMSIRSAVTVFHDFSDIDFASSRTFDDSNRKSFRYGSSGLELYGDDGDELSMTGLDSSELIGNNGIEESFGNENGGEVGEREIEREEDEEEEFSEGDDDSMFNYGSGCEVDNENEFYSMKGENVSSEFYSSRSVSLYEEGEVRNENPLLMNSSVAFGSHDLDDFLLQNGPVSVVSDLFYNPRESDNQVEENGAGFVRKEEKDAVIVNNDVEETKDIGDREALEEVRDRDRDAPVSCEVQGADNSLDLGLLPEEAPQKSLNITDGGSEGKGNRYSKNDEAGASGDAQRENLDLDNFEFKSDQFCDSRDDVSTSNIFVHVENVDAKSFKNLKPIVLPSNGGTRKILERSSTSTNVLEKSHVISKVSNVYSTLVVFQVIVSKPLQLLYVLI